MSIPSRTYENIFYMQKALERTPSRISSAPSQFDINQISHPLQTLTECDEVDERERRVCVFESKIPRRSKPGFFRPRRPPTCASSRSSYHHSNRSLKVGSTTTSTITSSTLFMESKTQTEVSGAPSQRVVLPGHGGPRLEVSPLLTQTPKESYEDVACLLDATERGGSSSCCRDCSKLKMMLKESEANLQCLSQQLRNMDRDLKVIADKINNNTETIEETPEGERPTSSDLQLHIHNSPKMHVLIPDPNPLVNDPGNDDKCCDTGDLPYTTKSYPSSSTSEIPQFDLDNFFLQLFEHPLMKEKMENGESESPDTFSIVQLLQVSVAARDCMAHTLEQKLEYGYKVLKKRFETLGKDAGFQSGEKDSPGMIVLNSYRKFVRFIYYYLKESLVEIENFDRMFLKQQSKNQTSGGGGLKYSYITTIIIDHKPISGVFIPLEFINDTESKHRFQ